MIYLLRHGQTEFNLAGRIQGQSRDSPLTELGRRQVAALAAALRPRIGAQAVALFTSPLGRTQETARLLAAGLGLTLTPRPDPRLSEVAIGAWEGMTGAEIDRDYPGVREGAGPSGWFFRAPGGERLEDVQARLTEALQVVRADPAPVRIIVSHAVVGTVLRGLHSGRGLDVIQPLRSPNDTAFALAPDGTIEAIRAAAPSLPTL